jgi:hypothetical protein
MLKKVVPICSAILGWGLTFCDDRIARHNVEDEVEHITKWHDVIYGRSHI